MTSGCPDSRSEDVAGEGVAYQVIDNRTGTPVWIASGRQGRPNKPDACPFCPGGLEAPDDYEVRWFPNRWPPMPGQRCEVVLFSPRHDQSLSGLSSPEIRRVIDVWAERTAAFGERTDVAAVLPFENRGAEVGATVPHPHGQIYAFKSVPPVLPVEMSQARCWACVPPSEELLITSAGRWAASVPMAARYPFEVLIVPDDHRPDLPSLGDSERDELSLLLGDVLARLDRLFDSPMPYMLWVHQQPTDQRVWPAGHVHIEIVGLYRGPSMPRFVAAGELGSGVWFNPLRPADAARQLREA